MEKCSARAAARDEFMPKCMPSGIVEKTTTESTLTLQNGQLESKTCDFWRWPSVQSFYFAWFDACGVCWWGLRVWESGLRPVTVSFLEKCRRF